MRPTCPKCGSHAILAIAPIDVKVEEVGEKLALAIPWGTRFPISLNARAVCNQYGCDWKGTVVNTQPSPEPATGQTTSGPGESLG